MKHEANRRRKILCRVPRELPRTGHDSLQGGYMLKKGTGDAGSLMGCSATGGEKMCADMSKAGLGRTGIYCNQKEVQLKKHQHSSQDRFGIYTYIYREKGHTTGLFRLFDIEKNCKFWV